MTREIKRLEKLLNNLNKLFKVKKLKNYTKSEVFSLPIFSQYKKEISQSLINEKLFRKNNVMGQFRKIT